jgi:hypothetical protein
LRRMHQKPLEITFPKKPSVVTDHDVQRGQAAQPFEGLQALAILIPYALPTPYLGGLIFRTKVELVRCGVGAGNQPVKLLHSGVVGKELPAFV